MRVGLPEHAASQIGPVIEPPQGKLARALTSVEEGQSWLLEPQCLSEDGMLWSPGIREGVRDGDEFHLTEYFGPILGIMEADTVKEAVTLVNRVDYGLTSGLHSLDNEEIARWMEHAESGNLYVNRSITGAIVQRQPFGGWKRSTVGTGTKAGGPHYVAGLGRWVDATPQASAEPTDDLSARVLRAADDADVDSDSRAWLAAALATDEREWEHRFATVTDPSGLEYEHNAWRYQAVPVTVRLGAEADPTAALRVLAAGLRTGCALTVSHAAPLAPSVERVLEAADVVRAHEDADAWAARANGLSQDGGRVRIVGEDTGATLAATAGSPAVAIHGAPPVSAGLVEMLPFLREQAVSVTAHRFGVRREYLIPPLAPARR
jgi:RHH-type proline utilization regulon transcriptional repressor/proline dehydrogenase/delta 1-pyrroline-5-carboxylate dehydrogenase